MNENKMKERKIRTKRLLTVLILTVLFIGGCKKAVPLGSTGADEPGQDVKEPIITREEDGQTPKGLNDFSLEMGSLLYQQYEGQNFVCSPISLWLPLAALVNATEGDVQEELLASLGMEEMSVTGVNEEVSGMLQELIGDSVQEDKTQLQIANIIYVNEEYTLNPEFEEVFADVFQGEAMTLDFKDKRAVKEINRWIEEKTCGEIKEVITRLDTDTVAALVNAIYFSDLWQEEFEEYRTKEDIFYAQSGESGKAHYMVRENEEQFYYEDERMQSVGLPFVNGAKLFILLPKEETAGELYQSLTAEDMERITGEAAEKTGTLKLPRFSVEGENMNLLELLGALQVPLLDSEKGGITQLVKESADLYISDAVQKAAIRVDEEGTTAAAATVIASETSSAIIEKKKPEFEMICSKPFVFLLTDCTGDGENRILFSGVINQP